MGLVRGGALPLLVICCVLIFIGVKGAERGKIDIQPVGNDAYQCEYVSFSSSFSSGIPVRVFASVNHGNQSSQVHDSAFVWVEDVTTSHFRACVVTGGQGFGGNNTIDWFAFQGSQSGVQHGQTRFTLFTTGTKCNQVAFAQAFSTVPKVHVTVHHGTLDQKKDAMNIWIQSISRGQMEVCLRESRTFDGPHSNLKVNWMAYEDFPLSWDAKESSEILFSEYEIPSAQDNFALCETINFSKGFYTPPVILTTVINDSINSSNRVCAVKGPLSSWVEEVTKSHFRVCVKDYAGYDGQRSNVAVEYLVIGDLDPCNNAGCKHYSDCEASSPQQFSCVCESSCPSYEEQVCATNGRTFRNMCLLKKEICETRGNYTHYQPGSCTGFPLQKGRHQFQNHPSWAEDQCETIQFKPYIFYPHQKIYIQLTVNHVNYSDAAFVHEATTQWVERVNSTQFTACVTRAGRNDYPADSFATVDWIAYQGAPPGGVTGEEKFFRWWTGTSCQTVTLPNGKYSTAPTIFATAEHHRSHLKHDAATVWLEDVSASSFKICIRELQNFAGVHDDVSVNWLAFTTLHRPLFSEHNDVTFQNKNLPSRNHNFAFCQDVKFTRNYLKYPTVLITAKHSSSGGNAASECNGIVSWIEFINKSGFRICVKELFVSQRFDPLNVSYAVLSEICPYDWAYFKGYCYRKVFSCDSWNNSQARCSALGANLPSIHSQEENVFVQHLHGGEHAWLGLSDINSEGTFVWSDGTPLDFHNWANHQPNNFQNEDCVHTLGLRRGHEYKWDDVNCSDCHKFSCKKDYNECKSFSHDCPLNATCVNNDGSYTCRCPLGHKYHQDGNNCTDINECSAFPSVCDSNANCQNNAGSYLCSCNAGYTGDGKTCIDTDECKALPSVCDVNAKCQNSVGTYLCSCNPGYTGNGKQCSDINECSASRSVCDSNTNCQNNAGSYLCSCNAGYTGDGKTCTDIDECKASPSVCDVNANCQNNVGSYLCSCKPGYTGNGKQCSDINECSASRSVCDSDANCQNNAGSYLCSCNAGYTGDGKTCTDIDECKASPSVCDVNANCQNNDGSFRCSCKPGYTGNGKQCSAALELKSCDELIKHNSKATDGRYILSIASSTFTVFCDMTSSGQGWTLISRFSNSDSKNWMKDSGDWWYNKRVAVGGTTDPSSNTDMLSRAFWLVSGNEFKITRSDDPQHSALLRTLGNCLGGRTLRSKITSYGNFGNGAVWASNKCRGSCMVQYDGQYQTTEGFSQVACSGKIQNSNKIGFWCAWDTGDGAVMMIGGGGSRCARADHGIGITEADAASFIDSGNGEGDFGNFTAEGSSGVLTKSYSLNLWIR